MANPNLRLCWMVDFIGFVAHHFAHRDKVNSNEKLTIVMAGNSCKIQNRWKCVCVCERVWLFHNRHSFIYCNVSGLLWIFLICAYFVLGHSVSHGVIDPMHFLETIFFLVPSSFHPLCALCTMYTYTTFYSDRIWCSQEMCTEFQIQFHKWNLEQSTMRLHYQPLNSKRNAHKIWHCFCFAQSCVAVA